MPAPSSNHPELHQIACDKRYFVGVCLSRPVRDLSPLKRLFPMFETGGYCRCVPPGPRPKACIEPYTITRAAGNLH